MYKLLLALITLLPISAAEIAPEYEGLESIPQEKLKIILECL